METCNIFFISSDPNDEIKANQIVQLNIKNLKTTRKSTLNTTLNSFSIDSVWLNFNIDSHEANVQKFSSNESFLNFWKDFLLPIMKFELIRFNIKLDFKSLMISHADLTQLIFPQITLDVDTSSKMIQFNLELIDWDIKDKFNIFEIYNVIRNFYYIASLISIKYEKHLFKFYFKNFKLKLEFSKDIYLDLHGNEFCLIHSRTNDSSEFEIQTELNLDLNKHGTPLLATQIASQNDLTENILIDLLKLQPFNLKILLPKKFNLMQAILVFNYNKKIYQLVDFDMASFELQNLNKKFLLDFKQIRILRNNLKLEVSNSFDKICNEISNDLSDLNGFQIELRADLLNFIYFPKSINANEWYLFTLNSFKSIYSYDLKSEIATEIIKIQFKQVPNQLEVSNLKDHAKSSCLLVKSNLDSNKYFVQCDFKNWINLITLKNNEFFKSIHQLIILFPESSFSLKFDSISNDGKDEINWSFLSYLDRQSTKIYLNVDLIEELCSNFMKNEFNGLKIYKKERFDEIDLFDLDNKKIAFRFNYNIPFLFHMYLLKNFLNFKIILDFLNKPI